MTIISQPFGVTKDGREVTQFTLTNSRGMQVAILSFGAVIRRVAVPDKNGVYRDVVLGYDTLPAYEKNFSFFGALVGRCANRIKDARFTLNGRLYRLKPNAGQHHLHGVFSFRVFDGVVLDDAVQFRFTSPPQEEGYPGTLDVTLCYRLTEDDTLEITYEATTDEDTVLNLTNHSYFNLNGQDGSDVLRHFLQLSADRFTELGKDGLPTGRILSVENTALDFRKEKRIGADIFCAEEQLRIAGGYDHNLIFDKPSGAYRRFAIARSEKTGIVLRAYTTEPAAQLYTGNFVRTTGKNGVSYGKFSGFCLEAQHYPCSPNYPAFPSVVLKQGETYRQKTAYRFSLE